MKQDAVHAETAMAGPPPVLQFGVVDHMDRGGRTIAEVYEHRLRLSEKYDEAGFYAFHPTEHHGTTLSCAPSPNVFLAAVAARTQRLRLSPMVYILPLYNPLRLIEETCMLDQLSRGRLELGVGRGIAPFEMVINGINPLENRDMYREVLQILELGLTGKSLTFRGHYHRYVDVPLALETYQKPHPPFWYGVFVDPESAVEPAQKNWNISTITPAAEVAKLTARYKAEWEKAHGGSGRKRGKIGINRTVIVADTDAKADELGRAAHPSFQAAMAYLWNKFGASPEHFPSTYDGLVKREMVITGTPDTVRREIERQARIAGVDYLQVKFTYGDMSDKAVDRSIDLFVKEVMPYFQPELKQAAAE